MWRVSLVFVAQIVVCHLTTEDLPVNETTTEDISTVTSFYALSVSAPSPIMLRLGNSTIDSTKSFKVPQPSSEPAKDATERTKPQVPIAQTTGQVYKVVPHVVPVLRNTHFDHDRRLGPTFEEDNGNISRITVQLGEDAHLNCRISLLQDKTVSWLRRRERDEIPELLTVGAVTYAADGRISVAKRYTGNWRLQVKEVKADDEGVYECQISTHPPRVSRIYLHVNTPQVWVVDEAGAPLLEKYYEAESTLALICRARHVDTPAVLTWMHEGRALNADTTRGGINVKTEQMPGGADSLLRLARVNSSDAGNYTCAVRGARPHTVAVHVLNGGNTSTPVCGYEKIDDRNVTILQKARTTNSHSTCNQEATTTPSEGDKLETLISEIRHLKKSVDHLSERIEDMSKNNEEKQQIKQRDLDIAILRQQVSELQEKLQSQVQGSVRNKIEIAGIPETPNENLTHKKKA